MYRIEIKGFFYPKKTTINILMYVSPNPFIMSTSFFTQSLISMSFKEFYLSMCSTNQLHSLSVSAFTLRDSIAILCPFT